MLWRVALAQFLGMTLWFSATAAAQAIAREFALTAGATSVAHDGCSGSRHRHARQRDAEPRGRRRPARLFALGCVAGAVANAAIVFAPSMGSLVVLRFATGAALATVYPPGMKIAAGWFLERRGCALGVVVGALTVGTAFPHLLAWIAADEPWRTLMLDVVGARAGGRPGRPHRGRGRPPRRCFVADSTLMRSPRDLRVAARLGTFGYLGHMWELYAMWAWSGRAAPPTASPRPA